MCKTILMFSREKRNVYFKLFGHHCQKLGILIGQTHKKESQKFIHVHVFIYTKWKNSTAKKGNSYHNLIFILLVKTLLIYTKKVKEG